jgi:phosphatidylglycerophosphate synthase
MRKSLALAPIALTGLRVLLAPIIIWMAYRWPYGPAFVVCLSAGFLSDVFDGILARRLGVATATLRRLDSAADVVFYLAVFWSAWVVYPEVMRTYAF